MKVGYLSYDSMLMKRGPYTHSLFDAFRILKKAEISICVIIFINLKSRDLLSQQYYEDRNQDLLCKSGLDYFLDRMLFR